LGTEGTSRSSSLHTKTRLRRSDSTPDGGTTRRALSTECKGIKRGYGRSDRGSDSYVLWPRNREEGHNDKFYSGDLHFGGGGGKCPEIPSDIFVLGKQSQKERLGLK